MRKLSFKVYIIMITISFAMLSFIGSIILVEDHLSSSNTYEKLEEEMAMNTLEVQQWLDNKLDVIKTDFLYLKNVLQETQLKHQLETVQDDIIKDNQYISNIHIYQEDDLFISSRYQSYSEFTTMLGLENDLVSASSLETLLQQDHAERPFLYYMNITPVQEKEYLIIFEIDYYDIINEMELVKTDIYDFLRIYEHDQIIYQSGHQPEAVSYEDLMAKTREYVLVTFPVQRVSITIVAGMYYQELNIMSGDLAYWIGALLVLYLIFLVYVIRYINNKFVVPMEKLTHYVDELLEEPFLPIHNKIFERELYDLLQLFKGLSTNINKHLLHFNEITAILKNTNQKLFRKKEKLEENIQSLHDKKTELESIDFRYKHIVNSIGSAIWLVDHKGKLLYVNDRFAEELGYTKEALIDQNIQDILSPTQKELKLFNLLFTRDFKDIEVEFIHSDGQIIPFSSATVRIKEGSKVQSVQGFSVNMEITNSRKREMTIRNREMIIMDELSKELLNVITIESVFEILISKMNKIISYDFLTARLLEGHYLTLVKSYGTHTEFLYDYRTDVYSSHVQFAIEEKRILVLESEDDLRIEEENVTRALENGKICVYIPLLVEKKVLGVIAFVTDNSLIDEHKRFMQALVNKASIVLENAQIIKRLRTNFDKTIQAMLSVVEAKGENIKGHSKRVSKISGIIGKNLYLGEVEVEEIMHAGLLHDIGKIAIKDDILIEERYNDQRGRKDIGDHARIGEEILKPIGLNQKVLEGIRYHHQICDGNKEKYFPFYAKIISFADELDNFVHTCFQYRPFDLQVIINHVKENIDIVYCEKVAKAFLNAIDNNQEEVIEILQLNE